MSVRWFLALAEDAALDEDWGGHSAYKHAADLTEATAASFDALAALHGPPENEKEQAAVAAYRDAARILREGEGEQ